MNKKFLKLSMIVAVMSMLYSCTTIDHSMREPYTRLNLNKSDFKLSDQVSAEAKTTKIIGVDWGRLFMKKTGTVDGGGGLASISLVSIPVIGNFVADKTANYALYELMSNNPGYDIVLYPQYETKVQKPILGLGFLTTITTVKATARLGKL